jgi:hypothetical protein
MKYSSKERLYFYKLARICKIQTESPIWTFIVEDIRQCKRILGDNLEYLYLENLTDNMFAYEQDIRLQRKPELYYGMFYQNYSRKKNKNISIFTIFDKIFIPHPVTLYKRTPKRPQRHRGYRDHGSLGSEFSKTVKQQATDWTFREKEEEKRKKRKDLQDFLLGFGGWV